MLIQSGDSEVLRDEIKLVAQAALPKFDFIYEIETEAFKLWILGLLLQRCDLRLCLKRGKENYSGTRWI